MAELLKFRSYGEFFSFYLQQHSNPGTRGLHAVGMVLGIGVAICSLASHHLWWAMLWIPLSYGFAWTGHFLLEMNIPATFSHPFWSLISDVG